MAANPTLFRPDKIATGLQAYWKLDEASGSRADSSGNGNTLTDNNTVTAAVDDFFRTAENSAVFAESNSEYLSRANGSVVGLGLTSTYSIALWFKMTTLANDNILIGKWSPSTGYMINVSSSDGGTIYMYHDGSSKTVITPLLTGKWYHLVITFNDATDTICFYLNGNLVSTQSQSTNPGSNSTDFRLGVRGDGSDYHNGQLKDVAVWNTVLTPIQAKSLAFGVDLSTKGFQPTDCAAQPGRYWKMNELSGTRVATKGGVDLTDNNTVTAEGGYREGVAARFTSANSEYLSTADHSFYDIGTGEFAVSFWANHTTLVNGRYFFSHGSSPTFGVRFVSGEFTPYIAGSVVGNFAFTFTTGVWYHILLRRKGGTFKVFIDGVEKVSVSNSGDITGATTVFSIGAFNDASNAHDGRIADFAIWSGNSPDDTEIKKLASCFPLQRSGVGHYYDCEESSGNMLDKIGTFDLTAVNSPSTTTGKVGAARSIVKASNQKFSHTDSDEYNWGTLELVIGMKVKFTTLPGGEQPALIGFGSGLSANSGLTITYYPTGSQLYNYVAGTARTFSWTPTTGVWYDLVLMRRGPQLRAFVDGVEIGSAITVTDTIDGDNEGMLVGDDPAATVNRLDGAVDEIFFGKRGFHDEEIKNVYIKGNVGYTFDSDPSPSQNQGNMLLFCA